VVAHSYPLSPPPSTLLQVVEKGGEVSALHRRLREVEDVLGLRDAEVARLTALMQARGLSLHERGVPAGWLVHAAAAAGGDDDGHQRDSVAGHVVASEHADAAPLSDVPPPRSYQRRVGNRLHTGLEDGGDEGDGEGSHDSGHGDTGGGEAANGDSHSLTLPLRLVHDMTAADGAASFMPVGVDATGRPLAAAEVERVLGSARDVAVKHAILATPEADVPVRTSAGASTLGAGRDAGVTLLQRLLARFEEAGVPAGHQGTLAMVANGQGATAL